jgi:arsenate reductase
MPDLVIFACVHNAGRSQMAAAFFNRLADPAKATATSGGTRPSGGVHLEVAVAMREVGIDITTARPRKLTPQPAALLVTMGCGDECPAMPVPERADWPLEDPKGKPIEKVRAIRDEIRARIETLIGHRGWK